MPKKINGTIKDVGGWFQFFLIAYGFNSFLVCVTIAISKQDASYVTSNAVYLLLALVVANNLWDRTTGIGTIQQRRDYLPCRNQMG